MSSALDAELKAEVELLISGVCPFRAIDVGQPLPLECV